MSKYEKVFGHYRNGFWDKSRVYHAVGKGWITEAEYKTITGYDYA